MRRNLHAQLVEFLAVELVHFARWHGFTIPFATLDALMANYFGDSGLPVVWIVLVVLVGLAAVVGIICAFCGYKHRRKVTDEQEAPQRMTETSRCLCVQLQQIEEDPSYVNAEELERTRGNSRVNDCENAVV